MPKLYAGLALILLLGSAFWYTRTTSYQDGVNAERAKWQEQLLEAQRERDEWKAKAETVIVKDRVVWRDRIQTIEKSPDTCLIPDDILRVLADAGIYVGPL